MRWNIGVVIGGVYEHYKRGDKYKVLSIAKHSETQENMVVYQALYGEMQIWTRPLSMWNDVILGVKRFKLDSKEGD